MGKGLVNRQIIYYLNTENARQVAIWLGPRWTTIGMEQKEPFTFGSFRNCDFNLFKDLPGLKHDILLETPLTFNPFFLQTFAVT